MDSKDHDLDPRHDIFQDNPELAYLVLKIAIISACLCFTYCMFRACCQRRKRQRHAERTAGRVSRDLATAPLLANRGNYSDAFYPPATVHSRSQHNYGSRTSQSFVPVTPSAPPIPPSYTAPRDVSSSTTHETVAPPPPPRPSAPSYTEQTHVSVDRNAEPPPAYTT